MLPVSSHLQATAPLPLSSESTDQVIRRIALQTLGEFAVSAAVAIAVSFFAAPITLEYLLSCALIQCFASLVLRCLEAFWKGRNETMAWLTGIIKTFPFWYGTGINLGTLVHESGHVMASHLVYQNPEPVVRIFPFAGGVTTFTIGQLTGFGNWLGKKGSFVLVSAGGMVVGLLVSATLFLISSKWEETYPEFALFLRSYGISDFVDHAIYALSTSGPRTNDFGQLYLLTGLHPTAAGIMILTVSLLFFLASAKTLPQRAESPPAPLPLRV